MTIKYECDRCHEQFTDRKDVCEVSYEAEMGSFGKYLMTMHYCKKCSIYYNNAVHNVNNGTFDGRVEQ